MRVHVLESGHRELLDAFVLKAPGSPIEQTWAWGELQCLVPGRPLFRVFAVVEGEDPEQTENWVASFLLIRQEMGFGKSWLWAPRGPVFKPGLDAERSQEAWGLLEEACKNWARLGGDVFMRVEPGFLPESFYLGGQPSPEEYLPSHSLTLDLRLSEQALLEQMSQKGRYNIKVAEKSDVVVREATDLPAFYKILKETSERDGFAVHSLDFYADFLRVLGDSARFYVAEYEGRILGGLLLTLFGKTACYYFGASSNEDRKLMAPYLLQWHAIRESKKAGCEVYDFLGIAPDGKAGESHALRGVTQFKTRFGGERVDYSGARVFVYRSLYWWARQWLRALRRKWRA